MAAGRMRRVTPLANPPYALYTFAPWSDRSVALPC